MIGKPTASAALAIIALSSAAVASERLYVPTVHILNTQGHFETLALAGFERGVSRTECEMRLTAWDEETGFTATAEALAAEGESVSVRLECVAR